MATGNVVVSGRKARESSIKAVVHRADGRVEDLGTIAYYHRNPIRRWAFKAWRSVNRVFGRVI